MWRKSHVLLGLLHGPLELLPVSSSAHLALARTERDHGADVALHLGAGLAFAAFETRGILERLRFHAVAAAIPAAIGALADPFVERRLGGPRSLAAGLLLGSIPLAVPGLALRSRRREPADSARPEQVPGLASHDALAIGLAQACALWPGVSRTGAVLAAARALGHDPAAAARIARETAVPVTLGAAAFKAAKTPWTSATARAVAASTVSTALARPLTRALEGPLWPFAVYRVGLALAVVRGSRR